MDKDEMKQPSKALEEAKDIIQNLIDDWQTMEGEQVRELKSVKEAEQFLKEYK